MAGLAFVNGVSAVSRSSFVGKKVVSQQRQTTPVAPKRAVVSMVKSKAMPFMEAPPALDGSMAGDNGFDPLYLSSIVDIKWMREAEIKHGRISMLATVGFFVQEVFTFPWSYFPKGTLPVDAHAYFVKSGGLGQVNLWISAFEIISLVGIIQTLEGKREPGYFGFDPLGFAKSPAAMKSWSNAEIINGRLAMCAIGGLIHQSWITKQGAIDQLLHFKPI